MPTSKTSIAPEDGECRIFACTVIAGGGRQDPRRRQPRRRSGRTRALRSRCRLRPAAHRIPHPRLPRPPEGQPTIFDVLQGNHRLEEAVVPARYRIGEGEEDSAFRRIPNLDLILGTPEMADAEVNLGLDPAGVLWLQNVLDEQMPKGRWNIMFFDCGPTLGILLLSIAMVGPEVIGCVADEFKYIIGLQDLEETLAKGARKFRRFGFKTEVQHILATNIPMDAEGKIRRSGGAVADDAIKAIRGNPDWDGKLLPIIRRKQRFKDTIVTQRPLRFLDPRNEALQDIAAVADNLGIQRLNSTRKR